MNLEDGNEKGDEGMKKLKIYAVMGIMAMTMTFWENPYVIAENISNEKFAFDGTFHTCDEEVQFQGNIHALESITSDRNGGYHVKIQWSYVNVKGVGLTSSTNYILKASDTTVNNIKAGTTLTGRFTSHAIALGPSSDFLIYGTYHITVDSDGSVVTEVTHLNASCAES